MDGARVAREKNLTFCEAFGLQPCIRPVFARRDPSVAMQPLWPLAHPLIGPNQNHALKYRLAQ